MWQNIHFIVKHSNRKSERGVAWRPCCFFSSSSPFSKIYTKKFQLMLKHCRRQVANQTSLILTNTNTHTHLHFHAHIHPIEVDVVQLELYIVLLGKIRFFSLEKPHKLSIVLHCESIDNFFFWVSFTFFTLLYAQFMLTITFTFLYFHRFCIYIFRD